GRDQRVAFPVVGRAGDRLREAEEAVRLARHRRDHDHDVVTAGPGTGDPPGDVPDAFDVGHRRPAELLDDEHVGYAPSHSTAATASPLSTFGEEYRIRAGRLKLAVLHGRA